MSIQRSNWALAGSASSGGGGESHAGMAPEVLIDSLRQRAGYLDADNTGPLGFLADGLRNGLHWINEDWGLGGSAAVNESEQELERVFAKYQAAEQSPDPLARANARISLEAELEEHQKQLDLREQSSKDRRRELAAFIASAGAMMLFTPFTAAGGVLLLNAGLAMLVAGGATVAVQAADETLSRDGEAYLIKEAPGDFAYGAISAGIEIGTGYIFSKLFRAAKGLWSSHVAQLANNNPVVVTVLPPDALPAAAPQRLLPSVTSAGNPVPSVPLSKKAAAKAAKAAANAAKHSQTSGPATLSDDALKYLGKKQRKLIELQNQIAEKQKAADAFLRAHMPERASAKLNEMDELTRQMETTVQTLKPKAQPTAQGRLENIKNTRSAARVKLQQEEARALVKTNLGKLRIKKQELFDLPKDAIEQKAALEAEVAKLESEIVNHAIHLDAQTLKQARAFETRPRPKTNEFIRFPEDMRPATGEVWKPQQPVDSSRIQQTFQVKPPVALNLPQGLDADTAASFMNEALKGSAKETSGLYSEINRIEFKVAGAKADQTHIDALALAKEKLDQLEKIDAQHLAGKYKDELVKLRQKVGKLEAIAKNQLDGGTAKTTAEVTAKTIEKSRARGAYVALDEKVGVLNEQLARLEQLTDDGNLDGLYKELTKKPTLQNDNWRFDLRRAYMELQIKLKEEPDLGTAVQAGFRNQKERIVNLINALPDNQQREVAQLYGLEELFPESVVVKTSALPETELLDQAISEISDEVLPPALRRIKQQLDTSAKLIKAAKANPSMEGFIADQAFVLDRLEKQLPEVLDKSKAEGSFLSTESIEQYHAHLAQRIDQIKSQLGGEVPIPTTLFEGKLILPARDIDRNLIAVSGEPLGPGKVTQQQADDLLKGLTAEEANTRILVGLEGSETTYATIKNRDTFGLEPELDFLRKQVEKGSASVKDIERLGLLQQRLNALKQIDQHHLKGKYTERFSEVQELIQELEPHIHEQAGRSAVSKKSNYSMLS